MVTELFSLSSDSTEMTERIGARIAAFALEAEPRHDFIALFGDLGAGKTALTRGIASVIVPDARVCSPTYAIVNEYLPDRAPEAPGKFGSKKLLSLFHFDMYRIEDEDSLDSIGFWDYLERGGIIVTEWSENIVEQLPERYLRVELLKISDDERVINVSLIEN